MKHLLRGLAVLLVLIICLGAISIPVFADDPPATDTNVDIGVVTPGNVNLGVNIDAGGDVTLSVNGVTLPPQQVTNVTNVCVVVAGFTSEEWWQYYHRWIEPIFTQLIERTDNQTTQQNLLAQALAQLIVDKQSTDNQTTVAINGLSFLITGASTDSLKRDNQIMDRLTKGAEASVAEQGQEIIGLSDNIDLNQQEIDTQRTRLDHFMLTTENNRTSDRAEAKLWVMRGIYAVAGLTLIVIVLLVSLIICLVKIRNIKKFLS